MLWLVIIAICGLTVMWILIVNAMSPRTKLFMARRQWLFLLVHIPVMWIMTNIGGEGLIFGLSSLIGGLIGQGYLAHWGTKQGLTWSGRRTPRFYRMHQPKKRRINPLRSHSTVRPAQIKKGRTKEWPTRLAR